MVCFMPSTQHDPRGKDGTYYLPPLCCHGCGCGEEQEPDEEAN